MNQNLNRYLTENYYVLKKIALNITNGNSDMAGELLHTVLLNLIEREPTNFSKFNDSDFKFYIIRCLSINWNSTTAPFYKHFRKPVESWDELHSELLEMQDDEYEQNKEELIQLVENEFAELDILHKGILELYLSQGSLLRVSRKTKIPVSSISRYVQEARAIIKNNITQKQL